MIRKLLITLKYGETKVKVYLIGVIVLLVAGIALMVMGISGNSLIFLGTGAVLLIAESASFPPFNTQALPLLKQSENTSNVTLGRAS